MTKIKKHFYTWNDVEKMVTNIITQMYNDNFRPEYIVGITRGGLTPAIMMSNRTGIPMKTLDVRLRDTNGLKGKPESNSNMANDAKLGKKILVVDDSNMQRKRISEFLQVQGYNTDEAGDGFEALKIADSTIFNAFLVDIQMPLMDGYELIENLRKSSTYNNTPVFVISGGHVDRENILSRLEGSNVSNFYEKPVDLEALIAELDDKLSIATDNLHSGEE